MDLKSLAASSEILIGLGMIAVGIVAQFAGIHNMVAMALVPFGMGLILSDILSRLGRATRQRVKVYIRRDDR